MVFSPENKEGHILANPESGLALFFTSHRQLCAAFSTTGVDNLAAIASAHSLQKTVNTTALTLLRLISTLHINILLSRKFTAEKRFVSSFSGASTIIPLQINSIAYYCVFCQFFSENFFKKQARFSILPALYPYKSENISKL